ncbi:MAG: phosphotransferase [Bacteroidota bacterium]|nr:phosphotransferase [Bacteroidota bacterium]
MDQISKDISDLFNSYSKEPVLSVDKIPQSGSIRVYYRIRTASRTFIATYGVNIKENLSFIRYSRHFKAMGSPVPEIFSVNTEGTIYIQQDFGDISLLNRLEQTGPVDEVYGLFKKSLKELAHLQIQGDRGMDYENWSLTSSEFGKQAIMSDLLYFKYYFLDTLQLPYDKEKLIADFETFSAELGNTQYKYFMFRDFQSRNIMIENDDVHFIDYQGGMKGALQYDVASLLWQAKAELSEGWKHGLLEYYMDCVEMELGSPFNKKQFVQQYHGYVLIRIMQVLGAYGFRGLFERKAHFLISIPLGLKNLRSFIHQFAMGKNVPEFERILHLIVEDHIIERFIPPRADAETPLIVYINSFSYKKSLPEDTSGNGGGFVFDCRAILNPGRMEIFRSKTGRDKEVKDFLEQQTKMPEYLNSVFDLVDISVEDYIHRGFKSLMVNFGCTGGQHRSVYAADSLARHLKNKFGVTVEVNHVEQESKSWNN